jgi:hypothetical protein
MIDLKIYLAIVFIGLIFTILLFLIEGKIIKDLKDNNKFKIWWRKYIIEELEENS